MFKARPWEITLCFCLEEVGFWYQCRVPNAINRRYHIASVLSFIFCLNLLCLDHNCAARQLPWTTGTGTSCLKTCRFYNKLLKTHFVCWGILELFITARDYYFFFYCEGYYLQLFHTFSFMQFLLSSHFSELTIQYDGILCLHSCTALRAALHVKRAKSMKATSPSFLQHGMC